MRIKLTELFFSFLFLFILGKGYTQQTIINGPAGSGTFGNVFVLSNGNYVIIDISYSEGPVTQVGAVYLYNGSTHQLISTLKGSTTGDQIGNGGITRLSNGNFVVNSTIWNNGAIADAGAVTWCNGVTGLNGVVSSSNSLVGSTANDQVGNGGITPLSNGHYIVRSTNWDNGAAFDAGAITWGNGNTGISGIINSSNSLVGSTASDQVGQVNLLSNGNYVVYSANWDNGAIANAGAATWCNGSTGTSGVVSSSNSLVGSTSGDFTGYIQFLSNGNYLVVSPDWDNPGITSNVGAVTWCNGTTGRTGVINSTNSLVGSTLNDRIGINGVVELSNGNYVVISRSWDNSTIANVGAVTWGSGSAGATGVVSSSNSLVGSTLNDQIGNNVTLLNNGNYVVASQSWDNGIITNVGAVTWCNGTTGRTGAVNNTNSLIGSTANDQIGNINITSLGNGNYVVASTLWDNGGIVNAGAVTWCNGTTGRTGTISSANSLVGSTANDNVGGGITILSNSNYIVTSSVWDNGSVVDAGAVTWCDGTTGRTGTISSANSLVGTTLNDQVGVGGIIPLSNGNYLVRSYFWNNGSIVDAGAITWGNGTKGIAGAVSVSNSLVGSTTNDNIGLGTAAALLNNGNYVVASNSWDNGGVVDAGAVTLINGTTGLTGTINSSNSLLGGTSGDMNSCQINRLNNDNFIVRITTWDNGAATDAGAVTWGSGTSGVTGLISSSNSLVGSTASDQVGFGISIFSNGNYVVESRNWDNGAIINAGAVTWCNGNTGASGVVSSTNSLVGSTASDQVGSGGIVSLSLNGNYYLRSGSWDNGAIANAGAVTWGNGSTGVSGAINSCNSVTGSVTGSINPTYNSVYDYIIAAIPISNRVVIYNPVGQALANHLDLVTTSINGNSAVPLVTNSSCRIIGTISPNGASPVSGTVNAQAWIESSVPTFAGVPFVARHYEITPAANASTATGRVTLYFTQQEFTDFNNHPASTLNLPTGAADAAGISNLRIGKYNGTSNNGTGLPGSYTNGSTIIDPADSDIVWNATLSRWEVSFDVTGFSGFIVQTVSSTLPVTLLEFNAKRKAQTAELIWSTASEQNNKRFTVQRSSNGRNFTDLGFVPAAANGNSAVTQSYRFTDAAPLNGRNYYRLLQQDNDGRSKSSEIRIVDFSNKKVIAMYPNPTISVLNISISSIGNESLQLRITDITGRVLKTKKYSNASGTLQLDVDDLAKGTYFLELWMNHEKQVYPFIKQ